MFLRNIITRLLYHRHWRDFTAPITNEECPGYSHKVNMLSTLFFFSPQLPDFLLINNHVRTQIMNLCHAPGFGWMFISNSDRMIFMHLFGNVNIKSTPRVEGALVALHWSVLHATRWPLAIYMCTAHRFTSQWTFLHCFGKVLMIIKNNNNISYNPSSILFSFKMI